MQCAISRKEVLMLMEKAIQNPDLTSKREQILKTMHDLYNQSRSTITGDTATLVDARVLTGYVMEVRRLLVELEQIGQRTHGNARTLSTIHELQGQYEELEGMVKEKRNSLERGEFSA